MATRLLSEREFEVLHLVAKGMPNLTIARTLFMSRSAAEKHLTNVVTRLGATTGAEEVASAPFWRSRLIRQNIQEDSRQ